MYIIAIMVTAIIFSITGLGVLNLAQAVILDAQTAAHTLENQIEVESVANIAIWRLNTGADSLGSFSNGDVTSIYDSTTLTLTINLATADDSCGFKLSLEEDHHFLRAIGTRNTISQSSYGIGEEPEHVPRENFGFLPEVDLSYWINRADTIYTGNDRTYYDADLREGILVFTGDGVKIENVELSNTTMIFTGTGIDFRRNNIVSALQNDSLVYPALVFTDSTFTFFINEWFGSRKDHIQGAIYAAGSILLRKGELSGPVVARNVFLWRNMDFIDDQYPQYYRWPQGFGSFSAYDWPKQIALWEPL
ncbi:MAG: hypothetical protein U9Q77_13140 [Candidatus Marinimicrobia bacterium]|nr:hypothetical protein [Candidatus Neomarinimicrobiota bacterium]